MSTSIRTKNVWGKDIEPEYEARAPRQRNGERGVGIRIQGLAKSFGDVPVLHDLDLEVPAGQFLAIVGKSGCGKSTLLRLLVGLDTPTSGRISFVGADGAETAPSSRIVFQEPRLLPWASVVDNVAVGLGEGVDRREARRLAEALAVASAAGWGRASATESDRPHPKPSHLGSSR